MPRPKGSKNKVKSTTAQLDYDTLIAEKSSSKETLVADIATLEENLTSIREELKAKKSELKNRTGLYLFLHGFSKWAKINHRKD